MYTVHVLHEPHPDVIDIRRWLRADQADCVFFMSANVTLIKRS